VIYILTASLADTKKVEYAIVEIKSSSGQVNPQVSDYAVVYSIAPNKPGDLDGSTSVRYLQNRKQTHSIDYSTQRMAAYT
jgi:hypothetical protein